MEFLKFETNIVGDGHIEIKATVPGADISRFMTEAYQTLCRATPNMTPSDDIKDMRKQLLDDPLRTKEDLEGIIKGYTLSRCVPYAIDRLDVETITDPMFYCEEEPDLGTDLEIFIMATLKPQLELTSYDPVTVDLPQATFTEADIDAQIAEFADNHASYAESPEKRPIEMGDYCHVDLTISKDGKVIPQLSGRNNLFQCSYESMPADFIDKMVGMGVGETRNFSFEGPAQEMFEPGQTETYFAQVTLRCLMEKKIPEITDEWFRENYPAFKSLAEFKADLSRQLEEKAAEKRDEYKGIAVDYAILDRLQGSVPDEIYEFVLGNMTRNFEENIKKMGTSKEEFFDQQNTTEQEYTTHMMVEARRVLRQGFALDALFRGRNMELTDEDIHNFLSTMAPGREDELLAEMKANGRTYVVTEEARRAKAHQWLIDTATYNTVEV